jgi:hypothetical protein
MPIDHCIAKESVLKSRLLASFPNSMLFRAGRRQTGSNFHYLSAPAGDPLPQQAAEKRIRAVGRGFIPGINPAESKPGFSP